MRWGLVLVAAGLVLAGCVPDPGPDQQRYPNGWTDADTRACEAKGGSVTRGLAGPACAMPTEDAGKPCRDGSECSAGICLAEGAQCPAQSLNFGCLPILEAGDEVTICID